MRHVGITYLASAIEFMLHSQWLIQQLPAIAVIIILVKMLTHSCQRRLLVQLPSSRPSSFLRIEACDLMLLYAFVVCADEFSLQNPCCCLDFFSRAPSVALFAKTSCLMSPNILVLVAAHNCFFEVYYSSHF